MVEPMDAQKEVLPSTSENIEQLQRLLDRMRQEASVQLLLLADEQYPVFLKSGEVRQIDPVALSTLVAAIFAASERVAQLLAEDEFNELLHQGSYRQMLAVNVLPTLHLIAIFTKRTPAGLVRHVIRRNLQQLQETVMPLYKEGQHQPGEAFFTALREQAMQLVDQLVDE